MHRFDHARRAQGGEGAQVRGASRRRRGHDRVERVGGLGNLWAGRWLANAAVRSWLPLAVAGSVASRRIRRATGASLAVPPLLAWWEERPDLDPVRWLAAAAVDDVSYVAGVWSGCWRERSWRTLVPRLSRVPGLGTRPARDWTGTGHDDGPDGTEGDGVPGVTP